LAFKQTDTLVNTCDLVPLNSGWAFSLPPGHTAQIYTLLRNVVI